MRATALLLLLVTSALLSFGTRQANAQAECALFVSTLGTDSPSRGTTPSAPLRTIGYALSRANVLGRSCVLVQAGTYTGGLDVTVPGVVVRGGFDADWQAGPATDPAHLVTITGGYRASEAQYLTVRAVGLAVPAQLRDLTIVAPDASGSYPGARSGNASYGVVIRGCTGFELNNVRILGGRGATGATGSAGVSATQVAAAAGGAGGDGAELNVICNTTSRGARGAAGVNPSCAANSNGGQGGLGGTIDTDCGWSGACSFGGDCTATPGTAGEDGMQAIFTYGGGGSRGSGGESCGLPGAGEPGFYSHGSGGSGGLSSGNGFFGNYWATNDGYSGLLGTDGGGGGGGGGSGGCDLGTDSYGAGGGGGGAGGCRAPASGGGGEGGGASIAVLVVNSTATIKNCSITSGTGGSGGRGGAAGAGQPGGDGGPGGAGNGSANGGAGGKGGRGGHAGGGGGGAGGLAAAILSHGSTITASANTYAGGVAGTGGAGGASVAGISGGGAGQNGLVHTTLTAGPEPADEGLSALAVHAFPSCNPVDCLVGVEPATPFETALLGAFPHPAREGSLVRFTLAAACEVKLQLFDVRGALVRTLAEGRRDAGMHEVSLARTTGRGEPLEPGMYFLRLVTPGHAGIKRTIVVR